MNITLTPQNFGEKMGMIYNEVLLNEKISLEVVTLQGKKILFSEEISQQKPKTFQERMNDPENTSYGPMSMGDFAGEMTLWMKES